MQPLDSIDRRAADRLPRLQVSNQERALAEAAAGCTYGILGLVGFVTVIVALW